MDPNVNIVIVHLVLSMINIYHVKNVVLKVNLLLCITSLTLIFSLSIAHLRCLSINGVEDLDIDTDAWLCEKCIVICDLCGLTAENVR